MRPAVFGFHQVPPPKLLVKLPIVNDPVAMLLFAAAAPSPSLTRPTPTTWRWARGAGVPIPTLPAACTVSRSPAASVHRRALPSGLYQRKRSPAAGAAGHDASVRRMNASSPLAPLTSIRPGAVTGEATGPTDSILGTMTDCSGVIRSASARSPLTGLVENESEADELPSPI